MRHRAYGPSPPIVPSNRFHPAPQTRGADQPHRARGKAWQRRATGGPGSSFGIDGQEKERVSSPPESRAESERFRVDLEPALVPRHFDASRFVLAAAPPTPVPLLPDPRSRSETERREASC